VIRFTDYGVIAEKPRVKHLTNKQRRDVSFLAQHHIWPFVFSVLTGVVVVCDVQPRYSQWRAMKDQQSCAVRSVSPAKRSSQANSKPLQQQKCSTVTNASASSSSSSSDVGTGRPRDRHFTDAIVRLAPVSYKVCRSRPTSYFICARQWIQAECVVSGPDRLRMRMHRIFWICGLTADLFGRRKFADTE